MDEAENVSARDAGLQALEEGRWRDAAALLDVALSVDASDRHALEGRAWAAWWLDQTDVLFRTREQAFHAHLAVGDEVGAARAATWLGCDHHEVTGEHAVGSGWHARARRLLAPRPTCEEHAWLAFQEGAYALELVDDTTTARRQAAEVGELAARLELFDLAMLALALEGLALVTEGQVAPGMRLLDEAAVAATSGEVRQRLAATWTLCYVIYACERVRDFDRTGQWCARMAQVSARSGFEAGVGICRVHYGGVLLHRGAWGSAEHELERSRRVLSRTRPAAVAESDARLGELRRRQGRRSEAAELLAGSLPHPVAAVGLAWLCIDEGDPVAALAHVGALLSVTPPRALALAADALLVEVVARLALGQLDEASRASGRLEAVADAVGNRPLRAMAAEAAGALADTMEEGAAARVALERAVADYLDAGMPFEAARARRRLADVLRRIGLGERALAERKRADAVLAALAGSTRTADVEESLPVTAARELLAGPLPTRRELEVLGLLARGLRDREIAERLVISPHTVHRHVSNILAKTGLPSRTAAAAYAVRLGLGDGQHIP